MEKPDTKLRTLFIVLSMMAVLSFAIGGYLYYSTLQESSIESAHKEATEQLRDLGNDIDSYMAWSLQSVKFLAGLKELKQSLENSDAGVLAEANAILDHFRDAIQVNVCYLMDNSGNTIASSNRDTVGSFVGKNYGFRPYFKQAMQGYPAVYMALGVTSKKRGIYFSQPIYGKGKNGPLGVVVIKASIGMIEKLFKKSSGGAVLLTDPHGIVFVSSRADWLYHMLWTTSSETISDIAKTRQFGKGPWDWTGVKLVDKINAVDNLGNKYSIHQQELANYPGWNLVYLHSHYEISEKITTPMRKSVGSGVVVLCVVFGLIVFLLFKKANTEIIQRKKAEVGQKLSLSKLEATLESTADGILVVDRNGKNTAFNENFAKMRKIPAHTLDSSDDDKALSSVLDQLKNPNDFIEKVKKLYADPDAKSFDTLHFKDGRIFERYSRPQKLDGKIIGRVWSFRDVTESKQAENALRESEKRLSVIYESAPDAYYINDYEGVFIDGNKASEELLGYSREELIGKNFVDVGILSMDQVEKALEALVENINGKSTGPDEYTLKRKDGTKVSVEILTHPVKIAGEDRVLGIARDITERKRVEEALLQSEEKYRQLFNNAPAGIYEVDFIKGKFVTVNDVMCGYSGYTKEELLSMSPLDLLTENSKKQFSKRLEAIFAGEKMARNVEYDIITKNGQEVCVILNSDFVYESGKLKGARVVVHDITKRKRLEEKLRYVHKMEAVGILAGGIAHQFNNALYAITGNIDLLEMDFPDNEKVAKYAEQMKASAGRMTQLTAQLLAYARGGKYQAETLLLSDFIERTLPLFEHTTGSDIVVDTDLPRDILNVKIDLTQIQMVLSAVMTNASEAMDGKGHIRVTFEKVAMADDTTVDSPELKPGNYACLTVIDDGKGMNEETRTRIFEPFFTTKFEGRGLGMAAAYGIVKNHDGGISVDSELDKGTTVKIYLPAVETPVKEDVKKRPRPTGWAKGTGTILVIDDEEAVMTVTKSMLERMGYRVLEARTGQEALDVIKTFDGDIDLTMLDILMPGMSGETLYPLLMKARPGLKVLVFSGYSIDGPAQKILDAGAQDFILKPFTMSDLSEKLKKIIGSEQ